MKLKTNKMLWSFSLRLKICFWLECIIFEFCLLLRLIASRGITLIWHCCNNNSAWGHFCFQKFLDKNKMIFMSMSVRVKTSTGQNINYQNVNPTKSGQNYSQQVSKFTKYQKFFIWCKSLTKLLHFVFSKFCCAVSHII